MTLHQFQPFGVAHLVAIGVIVLLSVLCAWLGRRYPRDPLTRWFLVLILAANELALHSFAISAGDWRKSWALPLHLCDLSLIALIISLLGHVQVAWELAYYWGFGGSILTVFMPDLPVEFPHYSFLTFFVHHGGVVMGVAYLSFSQSYALPRGSLKRVWWITHLYVALIAVYNRVAGTNYLFLCAKPSQPSLIDFLGPWPYYLLGLEMIFLCIVYLLYEIHEKFIRSS